MLTPLPPDVLEVLPAVDEDELPHAETVTANTMETSSTATEKWRRAGVRVELNDRTSCVHLAWAGT